MTKTVTTAATLLLFVLTIACTSAPVATPVPVAATPEVRVITATPSPTPPATPTPTLEPTPTSEPTPTPAPLAAIYGVELDRIQVIEGKLPTGRKPAILVGCHAHTISHGTAVFTRSGNLPRVAENKLADGIAVIRPLFTESTYGDGCYEMAVKPVGVGTYNYGPFASAYFVTLPPPRSVHEVS